MSRRKQAKPRSLKRDEEWEDGFDQNVLKTSEQDYEMTLVKPDGEEEEEEEEVRRAFSRHSEDYLQRDGGPSSVQGPDLENQNSLDSEALGTGSSSWHSEDGGRTSRRGGETPSSCATPTSASFPSEPEGEAENGTNMDGSNPTAPYPCQFCDRTFPRLSYLKKHEQSHGDQMPYRCSWCARLFKHKRSRDRHVKLHTGDRRYRCSHCEAAFSRSDHLKIHMKTHDTQKPYQCTACSRGYNTAAALTSHMQSHKKQQSSGQGSKLEMDFGRRSVSSHSTASPPVPNSPSPSLNLSANPKNPAKCSPTVTSASNTPILNSPLKLACMYCTRDSFTSMQQLQMHVHAMHQAILSGESMAMPSPGQMSEISSVSRDKLFEHQGGRLGTNHEKKCPEDREKSSENASLCAKTNLLESGFSCGQCTMKFSNFGSLRDHLVSIHRTDGFGTGLMMCPLCGIPCSSAAIYAEHYVLQHCDDRGIGFGESREYSDPKTIGRSLKVEGTYDTKDSTRVPDRGGIKSVKDFGSSEPADLTKKHSRPTDNYSAGTLLCGQCGAALKDFESFREHLARHLQADYRKEFPKNPCPKCDVSFQDREDMLDHLTKHFLGQMTKEYVCGSCKKYYPHPDLLQRHLLDSHTHHLYRCALCRDTFDSRVAIQVHFAVKHSRECRIYRCNVCSALNNENSPGNAPGESRNVFKSEAEMASHVRNVHAPPVGDSPLPRSPASTPGTLNVSPRCVFCGVCCTSDLELQLHLASHSSSLYRCPICREGFAVEFLLDRHMQSRHASDHSSNVRFGSARENGRAYPSRSQENTIRGQKRGLPSGNNNSLNQRDNNNKRANYVGAAQRCELCERGEFANEAELQAHKKLAHTPSKLQAKSSSTLSLTCAYCGETCRSRNELESHTRIQHASSESGGRHKCNICDEVCPSGATLAEHKLQKHCKIQLSDTCVVCRGILNTESLFMEHMQRHSLESVDPQQRLENSLPHLPAPCVVCRQTLISDLECRLHARHHLRATGSQGSATSSPSSGQKAQNSGCCLCLREFSTEDFVSLPSNHTIGGGQPLRVCKSCYVRHTHGMPIMNSPYDHVRSTKAERCWTSSKDTNWDGSRDTWDNDRKYKMENRVVNESSVVNDSDGKRCEDCGVKFEAVEDVERHRLAEHDKLTGNASSTYTCIQCQMSFATEAKIRQHVKEEHLESSRNGVAEVLRCHLCMFEGCSPLQLQCHLIEHTFAGCAALSCYICQALFTTPNGLQSHMLQQHGLGARPYDCSFCGLKFFFRAELDHHAVTFHSNIETTAIPRESAAETVETNRGLDEEDRRTDSVVVKEEQIQDVEEEEVNVDEQDVEENGSRDRDQADGKIESTVNGEVSSGKMES